MTLKKIKADTHREFGEFNWINVFSGFFLRRTYRVLLLFRLCHFFSTSESWLRFLSLPAKLLFRPFSSWASIDLPCKTDIGGGLCVAHGWGLVINESAHIGKNVTLFHGVTLGRRDRINENGQRDIGFPVIEDEVWIGPNAVIVGNVTIGKGSRIGAGAFVTEDIPPYSTVIGNPCKIVKTNSQPDVMNPAPEDLS